MNYSKINSVFSLVLILFLASCKDSNEYRVDPAFAPYLQRFIDNAAVHGRTFNPESEGLILEFATLKNDIAGLTHYEKPIRIEFDKTYWDAISGTAGADLMKEDLVFHELGHGLLNRKHLNTTLENGDWKSIMCGGDKVNGRSWNINYKGVRRLYYIDELFNESTAAPAFSTNTLGTDTFSFTPKISLSFDNEANAGWSVGEDTQHKISIENGRLRFESKVDDIYLVFAKTNIDIQSDFSYELNLQYSSTTDVSGQFGIIFGFVPDGTTGSTDPIEYFSINNGQKMYMGNRTWYSYFTELQENQIIPQGNNKLKVFKIGKMIYYFINNIYCYCSEMEVAESGRHFGFLVPPKGVVLLDNFSINQHPSSNISSKIKQLESVEFKAIRVKSLNQNIINK